MLNWIKRKIIEPVRTWVQERIVEPIKKAVQKTYVEPLKEAAKEGISLGAYKAARQYAFDENKHLPFHRLSTQTRTCMAQLFPDLALDRVRYVVGATLLTDWIDNPKVANAGAQTFGYDIFFKDPNFKDDNKADLTLLAHELKHTDQVRERGDDEDAFAKDYGKGFLGAGTYALNQLELDAEQVAAQAPSLPCIKNPVAPSAPTPPAPTPPAQPAPTQPTPVSGSGPVAGGGRMVVVREATSGRNLSFRDSTTGRVMSTEEFSDAIQAGEYPGYHVRVVDGIRVPASNPNETEADNLG